MNATPPVTSHALPNQMFYLGTLWLLLSATVFAKAETLEVHDNPVRDGTIMVASGDTDRSDWAGIPWYEADPELELYPVDIDRVRIAHDSQHIYFHLQTIEWDVNEFWRVGTYLDTDHDPTTGYNGDFLSVGADFFFEAGTVSEFIGDSQSEWVWEEVATDLPFDQTDMLDKEIAIPREAIGDAPSFDFLLFANNFCCDFQLPDDVYPDEALGLFGDLFTYELSEVVPGEPLLAGDADQDHDFDQLDLVQVQIAAKYLSGQPATWGEGDWDGAPGGEIGSPPPGDGMFDQRDIIAALGSGVFLTGPYAAFQRSPGIPRGPAGIDDMTGGLFADQIVPLPEPTSGLLLMTGVLVLLRLGNVRWRGVLKPCSVLRIY